VKKRLRNDYTQRHAYVMKWKYYMVTRWRRQSNAHQRWANKIKQITKETATIIIRARAEQTVKELWTVTFIQSFISREWKKNNRTIPNVFLQIDEIAIFIQSTNFKLVLQKMHGLLIESHPMRKLLAWILLTVACQSSSQRWLADKVTCVHI